MSMLPPAGPDQVRCDLDQHYEAIFQSFGGIPDLFHPPVYYSLSERLPLSNNKISTEPIRYFTRSYPGFQVAVIDDALDDQWLSVIFNVPSGFQIKEHTFYTNVMDRTIIGMAYVVLPNDVKLPGGFYHIIAFTKAPQTDIEFKSSAEGPAKFMVTKIGPRNPLYVASFVR